MNMFSHHIPFTALADFAEGLLTGEKRAAFEAHVSACSSCATQLAGVESGIELMRTDSSEDVPAYLLPGAVRLFRERAASPAGVVGLRRILASLRFDNEQRTPAFGLRTAKPLAARRLLFKAEENDVDVRVKASGEGWIVSGQVFGECSGVEAELQGEFDVVRGQLNELCEFTFPAVPAGIYKLRLHVRDAEIEINDLALG